MIEEFAEGPHRPDRGDRDLAATTR
jgi:hypothetical protein